MTRKIAYLLIILAGLMLLCAAITVRPVPSGLAWYWGGFDSSGIFLCPADGYISPAGVWIRTWTNPLSDSPSPFIQSLFTDC